MRLLEQVKRAKRCYIIGNGGSHANAMHVANDLISQNVPAFTLDPSTLTMFANDFGYENIYSMWLKVVADKGDLLIALSGSGKSPNILRAIAAANEIGMDVARVFGAGDMQQAEEAQLILGHNVMKALRENRS